MLKDLIRWLRVATVLGLLIVSLGCAASRAFRQAKSAGRKGDWDLAVARLTKAASKKPTDIGYKLALEQARVQAAKQHAEKAKKHMGAEELDEAVDELTIASRFDPGNRMIADQLRVAERRVKAREDERRRQVELEASQARSRVVRVPTPVLAPRSTAPILLNFKDASLQKILDTLGQMGGVDVLYDPEYRDRQVTVNITGVSFVDALDQITFVNRLFYRVIDSNRIIVVAENPTKRRQYDAVAVRTFYLENSDYVDVIAQAIQQLTQAKTFPNKELGAITVRGNPSMLALAERIVQANDKPRGEVIVEVQILEVSRNRVKKFGIELSNYEASVNFSPSGASGEVSSGVTALRAHFLSTLNLADFVVNIPSTLLTRFLQTDSTVKLLAAPRLRAAEGQNTVLKITTLVPIPVTTFASTYLGAGAGSNTGGTGFGTYAPTTSFQQQDVGVTLEMKPKVNPNGDITLDMNAEFSLLGDDRDVGGLKIPLILKRAVKGTLRVRDGETTIIGGLLQGRDADSIKGVLGLQSLPLINKLVTSHQPSKDETEILISLTPRLVRGPQVTVEDTLAFQAGTEEVVRVRGASGLQGDGEEKPTPTPTPTPMPSPLPPPAPVAAPTPAQSAPPGPPAGAAAPPDALQAPSVSRAGEETPVAPSPVQPAPLAGATASFSTGALSLRPGQNGVVGLIVRRASEVQGIEVNLTYDPGVVELGDVTPGALLTLDGSAVNVERRGPRSFVFARPAPTSGASSGVVASLTFRSSGGPGSTSIAIESLWLNTPRGRVQLVPPPPVQATVLP